MLLNQVPIVRVGKTFEEWKKMRENLKRIKERIESQDAILTPAEAMIPPETFGQYKNLMVETWQAEFCRQVLIANQRHKEATVYEIRADWDIEANEPSGLTSELMCNVLWDKVVAVPGLGFAACLILSNVSRMNVCNTPIPIDHVEDVKAWAVV
ncbi:hypothetical protein KKF64_01580 [Patescibacteria group bacterium]|nr:hypothetical protein [Patescibacteria group bacterium]